MAVRLAESREIDTERTKVPNLEEVENGKQTQFIYYWAALM